MAWECIPVLEAGSGARARPHWRGRRSGWRAKAAEGDGRERRLSATTTITATTTATVVASGRDRGSNLAWGAPVIARAEVVHRNRRVKPVHLPPYSPGKPLNSRPSRQRRSGKPAAAVWRQKAGGLRGIAAVRLISGHIGRSKSRKSPRGGAIRSGPALASLNATTNLAIRRTGLRRGAAEWRLRSTK